MTLEEHIYALEKLGFFVLAGVSVSDLLDRAADSEIKMTEEQARHALRQVANDWDDDGTDWTGALDWALERFFDETERA